MVMRQQTGLRPILKNMAEFFAYARERYQIKLRREAGEPPPWTEDPVIMTYRFCHVFREDDKTTVWLRDNIRDPLKHDRKVIFATTAFRWFNRIEIGEEIKDLLLGEWDSGEARRRLLSFGGPYTTGAYMTRTPTGLDKLDGVLLLINSIKNLHEIWECPTMEKACAILQEDNFLMGTFLSYEIVCDLIYTDALRNVSDRMTWANVGPGAARGIEWLFGCRVPEEHMVRIMREILMFSTQMDMFDKDLWPAEWPQWDMRTVEHTLCEYAKWKRGHAGQKLKRLYNVGA